MNDKRKSEWAPLRTEIKWWFEVKSVPSDSKKLTADVPQSPRGLLTSSLWGHKGGGAVTEIKGERDYYIRANDGVTHLYACGSLVSLTPSAWFYCLV